MNRREAKVQMLKKIYPAGTRLVCDYMDDPYAVPSGTAGTVVAIDSIGQIHMQWDNGQTLALNDEVDSFHKEVS